MIGKHETGIPPGGFIPDSMRQRVPTLYQMRRRLPWATIAQIKDRLSGGRIRLRNGEDGL